MIIVHAYSECEVLQQAIRDSLMYKAPAEGNQNTLVEKDKFRFYSDKGNNNRLQKIGLKYYSCPRCRDLDKVEQGYERSAKFWTEYDKRIGRI